MIKTTIVNAKIKPLVFEKVVDGDNEFYVTDVKFFDNISIKISKFNDNYMVSLVSDEFDYGIVLKYGSSLEEAMLFSSYFYIKSINEMLEY